MNQQSKATSARDEMIRRDTERLHALGYAQELYRAMGGFSNFAISFTIISVLSGCLTLFGFGLNTAGPAAGAIGWPIVSVMVMFVALSMAELASAYPTAGGLYYWASMLGGPGWGWFTGWMNLIGQVAVTAGIDFGLATFVNILMNQWWGTPQTPGVILITYAVALALHMGMNILGVRLVALLNDVSVWWHIAGVAVIAVLLAVKAPHHSLALAFRTGYTNSGFPYWYSFLIGLLLAQYTLTGFDASAHMTEETVGAETRAPWGVVMSVAVSAVAGYVLLMALLMAIPDLGKTAANGNPVGYILNSALGADLGTFLLVVAVIAQFYCGMSSITANSRMIYAFSRDGAMPLSSVWHSLHRGVRVPVNAIILGGVCSFLLAVPYLWNAAAYAAVTSIATVGLYISYVTPVYLRWRMGAAFKPGVWNLGRWSAPINVVAVVWVVIITVLFMLPTLTPIDRNNFNYTVVVLGVTVVALAAWWNLSVRHWFHGPHSQGSLAEMNRIEQEMGEAPAAPIGVAR